jgi:hypothetical protein
MADFLAKAYEVKPDEPGHFPKGRWVGPVDKLPPGVFVPCVYYEAKGPDGREVSVEVCANPTRFYRVAVLGPDGSPRLYLTTGAGGEAAALADRIAVAFASGMLGADVVTRV